MGKRREFGEMWREVKPGTIQGHLISEANEVEGVLAYVIQSVAVDPVSELTQDDEVTKVVVEVPR